MAVCQYRHLLDHVPRKLFLGRSINFTIIQELLLAVPVISKVQSHPLAFTARHVEVAPVDAYIVAPLFKDRLLHGTGFQEDEAICLYPLEIHELIFAMHGPMGRSFKVDLYIVGIPRFRIDLISNVAHGAGYQIQVIKQQW